jgi:DNA-binding transcriptional MerR regulator
MKIGELSRRTGISVSAIRFYERQGLLAEPARTESGYREYAESDAQRVRLIAAAKKQRLSLKTIRLCLEALGGTEEPCRKVAAIIRERLGALDSEIRDLCRLRASLSGRLDAFEKGSLERGECLCAILEAPPTFIEEKTMSTIEVFTAGCRNCDEAVRIVREAVAPCGCEVKVLPADSEEAKARGVNLAPCIWKDGQRVFCGVPSLEDAIALLRAT